MEQSDRKLGIGQYIYEIENPSYSQTGLLAFSVFLIEQAEAQT
jgi:hypothetical protein